MYWQVKGKNNDRVIGIEYADDGRPLRTIGPVRKRMRMYGMIARLLRSEPPRKALPSWQATRDFLRDSARTPKRKDLLDR